MDDINVIRDKRPGDTAARRAVESVARRLSVPRSAVGAFDINE